MLKHFLKDLTAVDALLDDMNPRETTELVRHALKELATALARTRDRGTLDALIVDAALVFDAVEDVRRFAAVLDPDLRPIAEKLERFLKDVMGAVADRLSSSRDPVEENAVHPEALPALDRAGLADLPAAPAAAALGASRATMTSRRVAPHGRRSPAGTSRRRSAVPAGDPHAPTTAPADGPRLADDDALYDYSP